MIVVHTRKDNGLYEQHTSDMVFIRLDGLHMTDADGVERNDIIIPLHQVTFIESSN